MRLNDLEIVSGGQTGADRAALDWAIAAGHRHGGWCPKGRRAEDGPIPPCYVLKQTPTPNYRQRTEWNVRDSDATIIFTLASAPTGGSLETANFARKHRKPCLHVSRATLGAAAPEAIQEFLAANHVATLNIAGSRASEEPGLAEYVMATLAAALAAPARRRSHPCRPAPSNRPRRKKGSNPAAALHSRPANR